MRKEHMMIGGILVITFLVIALSSAPNVSAYITPVPDEVFINQKLGLIKNSKTLTIQYEYATYVFSGEVINITCYEKRQGEIYTNATIKIDKVLKGSILAQTVSVIYSGGTVGNLSLDVLYNWIEGDYPLPTEFKLKKGDKIIAFVDNYFSVLVYINEPMSTFNNH
jgi:hypothetical protein